MSCGVQLDGSMDIMEETRFKKKYASLVGKLVRETHFTLNEVESLLLIYYKIQKDGVEKQPGITKNQFREFLHCGLDMTDVEMTGRVIFSLARGPNPIIPMDMWVRTLSLFLRGTFEEKIKHCYSVYDAMNHGKIGRDMMLVFLDNSLIAQNSEDDTEDAVKDMIEVLTKYMDWDRDGHISFGDFRKTCLIQPLLLEALGPCLPTRLAAHSFLTSFTYNIGKM